jgi:hypothetical protein
LQALQIISISPWICHFGGRFVNVAQESSDLVESPELIVRIECLEAWLEEVANDMLDRFGIAPMDEDCKTERIGS